MAGVPQDQSLHILQLVIDLVDVGEGQLKFWMYEWVVAEMVTLGCWEHPLSGEG